MAVFYQGPFIKYVAIQVKGGVVELKGYAYCFGEIILLLNMYKGRRGFKNLDYLSSHTLWIDRYNKKSSRKGYVAVK